MKRAFLAAALLGLGSVLGFPQQTVDVLTTEYEPFCGVHGDTMWCDLVNAAFAREGVTVRWQSFPQDREKAMVSDGQNVAFLTGTLVIDPAERQNFIVNPEPLIYASIVAFYPREKYPQGLALRGPGDLKGRTVGVVQGTASVSVLGKAGVDIDVTTDKDQLIKKLVAGREDIAVIADLTGLGAFKAFFPGQIAAYGYELVYSSPIDLVFSKKNPLSRELLNRYNSGISKIKADGTFMEILGRYYPSGLINRSILPRDMR